MTPKVNGVSADDLWVEFVNENMCGLCGNSGAIDTRQTAISFAGYNFGGVFYCICPNGRAYKNAGVPLSRRPKANQPVGD